MFGRQNKMILKRRLLIVCAVSVILLLIVKHCDAVRNISGRRYSGSRSSSGGSWWSKVTRGGSSGLSSSSSASKVSSSIGWNVPGVNSKPGAPPPYSNTHFKGLSNPNLQNAPKYSQNSPPGHQTIQSNYNPNHYQGLNYPRNTGQQSPGYTVQSNVQSQYPGINYPTYVVQQSGYQGGHYSHQSQTNTPRYDEKKPIGWNAQSMQNLPSSALSAPRHDKKKPIGWNAQSMNNSPSSASNGWNTNDFSNPKIQSNYNPNQYQGLNYPRNTGQQSPNYLVQSNYPNQGGHYSGMNYGGGSYPGYSGYSPAAPNGYFASGYPVTILSIPQRSTSGNSLTNTLLAGSLGLGLYNAIRPYPSYSGSSDIKHGRVGSTVHNHYYNSQAPGSNTNTAPVQNPGQVPDEAETAVLNQNEFQMPLAPTSDQAGITLANSSSADSTNAFVTPPPPTLAPNDKITDLDCVYAMKILDCSEILKCPQEWLHPSCLNRTISREYFDSITLPPPPPMPQASQIQQKQLSGPSEINQSESEVHVQSTPSNQSTNAVEMPFVPTPDPGSITLMNSTDPTNASVTPPPQTLALNDKITDLECVHAMKVLNCFEVPKCPQEQLDPSCLNRAISKENFDSVTSPTPMPEASQMQQQQISGPSDFNQNKTEVQAQSAPYNQSTNAVEMLFVPTPGSGGITLANSAGPKNASVTPAPTTLSPNDEITDVDCVYAMRVLNCTEIPKCSEVRLHPACLNRTISKDSYDSITLAPLLPPMPEANQIPEENLSEQSYSNLNNSEVQAQWAPSYQSTNEFEMSLASNNSANSTNSTNAPPTLLPKEEITDLDCVYAMKDYNCSEIKQCQEWLHPSCLNRTISKEDIHSVTFPPPPPLPPMPAADQISQENLSGQSYSNLNTSEVQAQSTPSNESTNAFEIPFVPTTPGPGGITLANSSDDTNAFTAPPPQTLAF